MKPLVITPAPQKDESLLGYILRLSERNGYDSPGHILTYANFDACRFQSARLEIEKIAKLACKDLATFKSITYSTATKKGNPEFKILGHSLGKSLLYRPLRLNKPAICPHCIEEDGYLNAFWDLSLAVVCPRHLCLPINQCHFCGKPLGWLRQGLMKCSCGADLNSTSSADVHPSVIILMKLIWAKLHNEPVTSIQRNFGLPIDELYRMPLRSLLTLLPALGKLLIDRKDAMSNKQGNENAIVYIAAHFFSEWPANFFQFLQDYGSRTRSSSSQSIGFIKRFKPLYNALFDRPSYSSDISFIRDEFLRFGLQQWGENVVDKKMLRDTPIDRRYMSITELAKLISVRPITLRRWAEKGKFQLKRINEGNHSRYIGDVQSLPQPKTTDSPTLQARTAAARLGIPVSVLSALKKSGDYRVEHMPKFKNGYSEKDLDNFLNRIFEASNLLDEDALSNVQLLSFKYIMQKKKFLSKSGKANFVIAYLKGELKSAGKTADDFQHIYFEESYVDKFASGIRISTQASNSAMTYETASKLLGCNSGGIIALIKGGYINKQAGAKSVSLNHESVQNFHDKYIVLANIAAQKKTTSRRLFAICDELKITVHFIQYAEYRSTPFILRDEHVRLNRELENMSLLCAKKDIDGQPEAKLKRYLNQLKANHHRLPRIGNALNKSIIAMECGFDRNTIYANKAVNRLLDEYDTEDKKLYGIQPSPTQALKEYLKKIDMAGSEPPRHKSGKLNRHAIASACNFRRQHLYHDQELIVLMDQIEINPQTPLIQFAS